jgi:hypothetical protein
MQEAMRIAVEEGNVEPHGSSETRIERLFHSVVMREKDFEVDFGVCR